MTAKRIRRRDALKAMAVGSSGLVQLAASAPVAGSAPGPAAAAAQGAGEAWKPGFLTPDQVELVATLAEIIIPETDTPGARAARVHEHIDLVLSHETEQVRKTFLEGLAEVGRLSLVRYGKAFVRLSLEDQEALLSRLAEPDQPEEGAGHRFFRDLRRRTVFAYYTSREGIHQELGYQGKQVLAEWEGCPHPGRHGDGD
ncbi:MAG: gluconate 2-dehydrogenase subunit 3 family protein [Candidatus Aminicenantes bacterium]|nr:gluconate 2-dehydrogenase subunit 3 family protein [Candidatus Aminicenantes bacterium]